MRLIWRLFFTCLIILYACHDYHLISFKNGIKVCGEYVSSEKYDETPTDAFIYTYKPYPFLDAYWCVVETKGKIVVVMLNDEESKLIEESFTGEYFSNSVCAEKPLNVLFYILGIFFVLTIPKPKKIKYIKDEKNE